MARPCSTLAILALAFIFACPVFGQAVNGSLVGTVTDIGGGSIANAPVAATEQNTGITRSGTTNESGNYTFSDLAPGTYRVSVEQPGFRKAVKDKIDVLVNTTIRADLQLSPGNVTETVEVSASAAILQTDRSDTGRKIETRQVADLPLGFNRNFQGLLNLVPGTTKAFRPHSEFFNAQDSLATQVNGNSRLSNNVQFEGIDDNERTGLLTVLIPPVEAIQTVDVTTGNYEAELGRAGGAVTNVLLKSGTNQIHGAAYEINRVSKLSSRGFFDNSKAQGTYNYFGANVGGPIIKNRTFFFGDVLRTTDHRSNTNKYQIPTAAERNGDLGATLSKGQVYDPATGNPDGTGRQPFPGNVIPASRINPISARILNLVPLPNLPGETNNFFQLTPFHKDAMSYDVKVDHNQTENDRIAVRYSYQRPVVYDAPSFGNSVGGPRGGGFAGTGIQVTHSGAINYDRIFSPTLLAEFRAGVNRYRNDAQQTDYGKKDSDALGVPGVNLDNFTSGLFGVDVAGGYSSPLVGFSPSLPWVRAETNIDFVNTWTKTIRNHTVKWGFDMRRLRDDLEQTQTFSPRGLYRFREGQTSIPGATSGYGNDLASFLLDLPSEAGRDILFSAPAYRAWQIFGFAQDKWQITPKLTIDIGLRWEHYPPATPHHTGGFSNYDPDNNTLVVAGVGGNPLNAGLETHYKDFAPRFGAAYRLNEKTVIRAGYGISYIPYPDNTYAYNFPVKQNNAFEPGVANFGPALLPNGSVATFQAGFPAPSVAVIPSNGIISASTPLLINQVYEVVNRKFREGYVQSYNLAVQRSLPDGFVLDVAYVGNRGVDDPTLYNLNAGVIPGAGNAGRPLFAKFGRTADTNLRYVGTSSNYNALQVKLDHRFSSGFILTTAYTFSKALGYQPEDAGLQFYIDQRRNYSRLDFDRTHSFVQSYVYELPFGKGKKFVGSGPASYILGGWQLNGILTAQSGLPLFFTTSAANLNAPGNTQTPNIAGPVKILHGIDTANWFDTSNFSTPAKNTFGNLGRNILGGPGLFNLDASIFRRFRFNERFTIEFRGESLSLTNTPQFDLPNHNLGDANFGKVKGTIGTGTAGSSGGARSFQLGAKLIF
ncbi:MAG: TonB-dependent receptor domain-containing protein [Bryobacteraceae bacterium]